MNSKLLSEILTSHLMLSEQGIRELQLLYAASQSMRPMPSAQSVRESLSGSTASAVTGQSRVAVFAITGVMTKYARYDFYSDSLDFIIPGLDDIAQAIADADKNESIVGSVLLMNTPGGTVQSWIRIEEVLRSRKKPCIAVVDGMCASAGVYVASLCDKVIALNKVCQIGSIGVMAHIIDTREAEKKQGIRIIEVYPPESKWKNKAVNEALDGDTEALIREELSPLAQRFQQVVRERRKQLDEQVEGVLEGRMFLSEDALKAGLIDDIMTLKDSISLVAQMAQERAEIINSII